MARRAALRLRLAAWACLAAMAAGCGGGVPLPTVLPTVLPSASAASPATTTATTTATLAPTAPVSSATASSTDGLAADLLAPGRLTLCSTFPRTRFAERKADGTPFGVDIEIGLAIAERMGLEPDVQDRPFETLIDAVTGRQCDVTIAGQFITASRLERIAMIPYRQGTQHVIVKAGNPLGISRLLDLCGRAVAVVSGTIHVDMVNGLGEFAGTGIDDQCRGAGRAVVDLRQFPAQQPAEAALVAGEADAYIGNDFVTVDRPTDFALGPSLPPARNGIGLRKEAASLAAAITAAFGAMIADRSYQAILDRYGAGGNAVTTAP